MEKAGGGVKITEDAKIRGNDAAKDTQLQSFKCW